MGVWMGNKDSWMGFLVGNTVPNKRALLNHMSNVDPSWIGHAITTSMLSRTVLFGTMLFASDWTCLIWSWKKKKEYGSNFCTFYVEYRSHVVYIHSSIMDEVQTSPNRFKAHSFQPYPTSLT